MCVLLVFLFLSHLRLKLNSLANSPSSNIVCIIDGLFPDNRVVCIAEAIQAQKEQRKCSKIRKTQFPHGNREFVSNFGSNFRIFTIHG